MSPLLIYILQLGSLIFAYTLLDALLRKGGLLRILSAVGFGSAEATLLSLGLSLGCAALFWGYGSSREDQAIRWFSWGIAVLLAWNASTRDVDPVDPEPPTLSMKVVFLSALSSFYSPAFLLLTCVILSASLKFWLHHASFPMRRLQALAAYQCILFLAKLVQAPDAWTTGLSDAFVTFLVTIQVSHYFITALAKIFLGPSFHSWVKDNRLHFLSAVAYSWGWARFVPWRTWYQVVRGVRSVEKPLQLFAFSLELLSPLALLGPSSASVFSLLFCGFHGGVFCLTGLLFWDWMVADLALAGLIWHLGSDVGLGLGPVALLAGALVLVLFPLRHRLWQPMPLGWFDTPLSCRVHWEVVGKSGKVYGLYNNYMCPHERLYGRVNGSFFVTLPMITFHLGEVFRPELREEIEAAGPDLARLEQVRRRYGVIPYDEGLATRHRLYLQAFFSALNAGARKSLLPDWARWLKAPGDQIFYWGELPAYRSEEPVIEVRLRYVEEYFDGEKLVRLRDNLLTQFPVPKTAPEHAQTELTPSELDAFLLTKADGRLILLPGGRKKYAQALRET